MRILKSRLPSTRSPQLPFTPVPDFQVFLIVDPSLVDSFRGTWSSAYTPRPFIWKGPASDSHTNSNTYSKPIAVKRDDCSVTVTG